MKVTFIGALLVMLGVSLNAYAVGPLQNSTTTGDVSVLPGQAPSKDRGVSTVSNIEESYDGGVTEQYGAFYWYMEVKWPKLVGQRISTGKLVTICTFNQSGYCQWNAGGTLVEFTLTNDGVFAQKTYISPTTGHQSTQQDYTRWVK